MAVHSTNLTTWSTAALGGSNQTWDSTLSAPAKARTEDGQFVNINPTAGAGSGPHISNYLKGTGHDTTVPSAASFNTNAINVRVKRQRSAALDAIADNRVHLTLAGVVLDTVNAATATTWDASLTYEDHVFTAANLVTLGLTVADIPNIGAAIAAGWDDRVSSTDGQPNVDHMFLQFDINPGGAGVIGQGLANDRILKGFVVR